MTEPTRRLTAADFDPEVLQPVRQVRARRASTGAASSTARAKFAVGGVTAAGAARGAEPELRRRRSRSPKTDRAHQGRDGRLPVAAGLRHGPRLPRAAGGAPPRRRAKLPAVLVVAREPRPQSAHRGHRAAPRARQLHRLRARRAVSARRLSRRRGQGARAVRQARPGQDARGLPRRGALPEGRARRQRQDRRGRLLLRRRHRQHRWRRGCPISPPAVPFYGAAAGRRRRRRSRRRC